MKDVGLRVLLATLLAAILLPLAGPFVLAVGDASAWRRLSGAGDRVFWLIVRSACMAGASALLAAPLGGILAWVMLRCAPWWRGIAWIALASSAALAPTLHAGGWLACIGPYGWFRPVDWGLPVGVRGNGWAALAAAGIHAVAGIPWATVPVALALVQAGRAAEEKGLLDGDPGTVARFILWPTLRRGMTFGGALVASIVLTDMGVCDLFAIRSLPEEVFVQIEMGVGDRSAILVSLAMMVGLSVILAPEILRVVRGEGSLDELRPSTPLVAGRAVLVRRVRLLAAGVLIVVLLPIAGLVRQLGWTTQGATGFWSASRAFEQMSATIAGEWPMALTSAGWSAIAAILTMFSASLLTYAAARSKTGFRAALGLLAVGMIVLPGPVLGLGLVELFQRPDPWGVLAAIYDSPWIVVYGQALRALPWILLLQGSAWSRVAASRWEAMELEGAGGLALWWRLLWGSHRQAMAVSFFAAWALAMSELPVTKIVAPPGFDPLSVRVFGLLHVGTSNEQAALVLGSILITVVLVSLALARIRR